MYKNVTKTFLNVEIRNVEFYVPRHFLMLMFTKNSDENCL